MDGMSFPPFTITEPAFPPAPFAVDSPHSGRRYPSDFNFSCPLPFLRQTEDFLVDQLIAGAADAGAAVLQAEFPRSYIDVNRAEDDLDPAVLATPWPTELAPQERTLLGLGLVRRLCKSGVPMYQAALPVAEVQRRINDFYKPYHTALEMLMNKCIGLFGVGYLLNIHSMPSRSGDAPRRRPDIVLGDRQGTSCDPYFTRQVRNLLQDLGFSVALNEPYKGMEIVRRHGQPHNGRHALQIEINRRLYMDEEAMEPHEGFARLQKDLAEFFHLMAAELAEEMPFQLVAE